MTFRTQKRSSPRRFPQVADPNRVRTRHPEEDPHIGISSYALPILLAAFHTGCSEPPGPPPTPLAPIKLATKEQHRTDDASTVTEAGAEQLPPSQIVPSPVDEKPALKTVQGPKPTVVDPAGKGDSEPEKATSAKEIVSGTLPDPKLIRIPAGKCTMGSPKDEKDRETEEKQHEVTLTQDYYTGETHVTVGQWKAFQRATGHDGKAGEKPDFQQDDDHPVVNVNWEDATAFCARLSEGDDRKY